MWTRQMTKYVNKMETGTKMFQELQITLDETERVYQAARANSQESLIRKRLSGATDELNRVQGEISGK